MYINNVPVVLPVLESRVGIFDCEVFSVCLSPFPLWVSGSSLFSSVMSCSLQPDWSTVLCPAAHLLMWVSLGWVSLCLWTSLLHTPSYRLLSDHKSSARSAHRKQCSWWNTFCNWSPSAPQPTSVCSSSSGVSHSGPCAVAPHGVLICSSPGMQLRMLFICLYAICVTALLFISSGLLCPFQMFISFLIIEF